MIVEPFAHDHLAVNPVGRAYYAASAFVCTPASLAQDVGLRGWRPGRRGKAEGGRHQRWLHRFRRTAETPSNMVLEARP